MKKLSILFFVLSTILVSCSSDDDGANISASIVGKWIATDIEFEGDISAVVEGERINFTFTGEPTDLDHSLTFTESPNEVVSEGGFDLEVTTNLGGFTDTETVEGESIVETGSWEQNGNLLTVANSGEGGDIEIFELTATRLIIGTEASETETIDDIETTLNSTFKIIYIRE
ncbi:lipocalin family protein [Algibacter aquimarinus]|uniref:Lipocalin-like domain-containing protein n=1 Tax=Algibacter aquimarinus TaxID=1136748 RepID=A0ABP9HNB3_9FLAO